MKYQVVVRCTYYLSADVEADSFEEAYDIAESMDGGEFIEDPCSADWEISLIINENSGEEKAFI